MPSLSENYSIKSLRSRNTQKPDISVCLVLKIGLLTLKLSYKLLFIISRPLSLSLNVMLGSSLKN